MIYRALGTQQLRVSAIGYGCPSFIGRPSSQFEADAIRALHRAIDLGVTFIDCADHNEGNNEEILGKAFRGRWKDIVVTTKIGNRRSWAGSNRPSDGRPESIVRFCDGSLARLGAETIDLLYLHRVDPTVPIEETIGAMKRLIEAGKVKHIGICEAGPPTLRRAHAVHPITALQSEYSLWFRDYERDSIPAARTLGIGFVAYNPMARGFLAGAITAPPGPGDGRRNDLWRRSPRLQGDNFTHNYSLFTRFAELAAEKGCTPGQLGLAWSLAQGDFIVPIPGTASIVHLEENSAAVEITLSDDELEAIDAIFPRDGGVMGPRFGEDRSQELNI